MYSRERTRTVLLTVLAMFGSGLGRAQTPFVGQLNPLGAHQSGLHFYGAYAYASYLSSPGAFNQSPIVGLGTELGHDVGVGGGTAIGWNHFGSGYNLTALYAPSYTGFARYSDLNSFNQSFSFNANRNRKMNLDRKWSIDFSGNANISDTTATLFNSTFLSRVIGVPASFDELAGGVVTGNYTNDQLAALLTGAPVPGSAVQLALYGSRMLNAVLGASLTYRHSSRLSVYWSVNAGRMQSLETGDSRRYIIPHSTSGGASTGLSYSLSPRTQVGVSVGTSRTFSRFEDAYNTTGTVSLGRIMGRRWFFQAHAGSGFISPLRQTYSLPQGPQYFYGGSMGYKTFAHTFMVSHDRGLLDAYGLGASSTMSSGAAWAWRLPGRSWSVYAGAAQQQMRASWFGHWNTWQGNAGVTKTLTRQTGVALMLAYLSNASRFTAGPHGRSIYGAVLSFYWVPGGEWHP